MQRVAIVLTSFIAACQVSVAAPHAFQDHNFAIEFPSGWRILDPPPPQSLAACQSPDGLKTIVVLATKFPANELSTAVRDMLVGAKQSAIDNHWQITNEHETSLNGVPFHTFTARASAGATDVVYTGLAGDEGYTLQGICKVSDAGSDPEVTAALNSFRLLSPRSTPTQTIRPITPAYRVGYMLGQLLLLALIGAGVVWLIRRAKTTNVR